jgi:SPP1 gp7 family putative phage head morphogenesis protein
MDATLSYTLAEGMARGDHPYQMAKAISGRIDAIGLNRAKTLARTEVIRAHHNANINELEAAGIEGVKVKAEWSTAGFNVCPICDSNEGREFTLGNIRGLIPAHPNCRCCAIPVVPRPKGRRRRRRGRAAYKYGRKPQTVKGVAGRLPLCPVTNITANATISCISRKDITKVNRAKKAYVPATKEMQRLGEANEGVLAKIIKGKQFPDNEPFDVVIMKAGKRAHMIEVKTLIKSKVDKITMRKGSRLRKVAMAEKHPTGKVHTIVFDNRSKVSKIYHADGVGSFRLSGMEKVDKKRLQEIFGVTKGKTKPLPIGKVKPLPIGKVKKVKSPWKPIETQKEFNAQMKPLFGKKFHVTGRSALGGDIKPFLDKHANAMGEDFATLFKRKPKLKAFAKKHPLNTLRVENTEMLKVLSTKGKTKGQTLYAHAYYDNKEITSSLKGYSNKTQLKIGERVYNVTGNEFAGMMRHEYGHHVYHSLPAKELDKFIEAYINGMNLDMKSTAFGYGKLSVSKYANTNVGELFSESFAAYTSPSYGGKKRIPVELEKLFKKWFN